jgi:hypothetical protein
LVFIDDSLEPSDQSGLSEGMQHVRGSHPQMF